MGAANSMLPPATIRCLAGDRAPPPSRAAAGPRSTVACGAALPNVIKALAFGARAVLIGRPVLWGLAAGGREGVAAALEVLRRELDLAMALCGCATIANITRDLVQPSTSGVGLASRLSEPPQ